MSSREQMLKSSIGYKIIMALSGAGLIVFVILHMAGNLQIFIGQDAFNRYAETLRGLPVLLWTARLGLLFIFLFHLGFALVIRRVRSSARPMSYRFEKTVQASLASRTMLLSGLLLLVFVAYHIAHFTLGWTNPGHFRVTDATGRHDVYSMVILGFQNVFISGSYILAMVLLGFHLSHGATSLFQTLGINHPWFNRLLGRVAPLVVWGTVLGFISIPLAVLFGWLQLPSGGS